jgi:1,2-diacylglycerol 3-alpha-glucosyltransferase
MSGNSGLPGRGNGTAMRITELASLPIRSGSLSEDHDRQAPQRRLSICLVSDDFLPAATGCGVLVQWAARELVKRGHSVSVVTSRRSGQSGLETWHGVRVHRTFSVRLYGLHWALPGRSVLRRILNENDFDIIHYHFLGLLLMRMRAAASTRAKHVYTYNMTVDLLTQPLLMKPFHRVIFRRHVEYCNRFDLILAPSARLVEQISKYGITTRTEYLSNPIVFDGRAEQPLSPEDGPFVVLFVGRLSPEKNLPYLIRAFAGLVRQQPCSELRIVGEGREKPRLMRLASKLGLERQVKFLGFIENSLLAPHYASADVFVLPSLSETQGMVALEAMWFAKPVIVTNRIVAARELVEDGRNGFIVDPDSVEDLTGKLALLSRNPALARELGRGGQRLAERYSPEPIICRLERHYLDLVRDGVRVSGRGE